MTNATKIYKAEYRTINGMHYQTDYIHTAIASRAQDYIDNQIQAWGAELIEFKEVQSYQINKDTKASHVYLDK